MSSHVASLKASGDSGRATTSHPTAEKRQRLTSWYRGRLMESSSTTLRLPRRVRAAALAAIGGTQGRARAGRAEAFGELAWMSWAGTVWRLAGPDGAVYVKRAAALADERDRLAWLHGRLPVPEVIGFYRAAGDDWLMTREIAGAPLYSTSIALPPARPAAGLGAHRPRIDPRD